MARAPKQWSLTKNESINTFEAWRQNLVYTLSLDQNFAPFMVEGCTWLKKTPKTTLRGFADDGEEVAEAKRRTKEQKVSHLELMLGQIANYCPIISRNTIVKNSTSLASIWQSIRLHFGFQSTGAHFIDFDKIKLEENERPEDLYQRLTSFVEDNLLRSDGNIKHHGEAPSEDEDLTPSLENIIVLTWLRLIHKDLPSLVRQRYGTELRTQTLSSLKPEISQALDSLLDEIHSTAESKIFRAAIKSDSRQYDKKKTSSRSCPLCKQAGRKYDHFLSTCRFLPQEDRKFMSRARQIVCEEDVPPSDVDDNDNPHIELPSARLVNTKQSPSMKAYYNAFPVKLTLDSGAEVNMIKASVAQYIGAPITKSKQGALQADGVTPLQIIGETHIDLSRNNNVLHLEALVVNDLDVDVLAGIPFLAFNDISLRPAKHMIMINDSDTIYYGVKNTASNNVRRTKAFLLRATPVSQTIWPGEFIEVDIPDEISTDSYVAIEPRFDNPKSPRDWPYPDIIEAVGRKVRIANTTNEPQILKKNEHFSQVYQTSSIESEASMLSSELPKPNIKTTNISSEYVTVDPDNILSDGDRHKFTRAVDEYREVFSDKLTGYNGKFKATINIGPVQPPQRKGRVPQYSRDKLSELQNKFDELEASGVFRKPEEVGVVVEYLNPSFLVKKPTGGHRLVTAFADVGRYSKPQPSLMPDVDSVLRTIAPWKYIIKTDLTKAFYQIPLDKDSMKYCGVVTPFRGVRVYTRCAMGMPGSETALEEIMCRVLGDCLQEGIVAKLADDLYCGADTPEQLLSNWTRVLAALKENGLSLSASKTVICPRSTTILGWIWSDGSLSASPHKISALSSCRRPETVRELRAFIGAYKILGRVLHNSSHIIAPLDDAVSGKVSSEKLIWTDNLEEHFATAQKSLTSCKSIVLPRPSDILWIVTDGSVTKRGIGATLYVSRANKIRLAGFFSAKLRKHQVTWLPCEIEALSIASAIKHFSPFIIQSKHQACVLTDSKPCVQAIDKLCRGEFSASPRVTSFLSIASRYQISIRHLAGSSNIPSDFASRNATECVNPQCQICSFIIQMEESVVRNVKDKLDNMNRLPFTTRSAWKEIQNDCPDLRRTHAHLTQGTRPSKKLTNIKDVKRYLNNVTIAKDGLLVVRRHDPLAPSSELIVVPRQILDGLVTALHIKLDHPTKYQLLQVMKRSFYALDMSATVDRVCDSCHLCASLKKVPEKLLSQSSEDPPAVPGVSFAADIMKRCRQLIFVLRETATSFTACCKIEDEKHMTLRDALLRLIMELHPIDGPPAIVRVDPAPGFISLQDDKLLQQYRVCIEIGRVKNVNKNPVAEKAIAELEEEILKQEPGGGPITDTTLAITVARLNSRIRHTGLSARELWTQRNQYTHEQVPIHDRDVILGQYNKREQNHPYSEKSKHASKTRYFEVPSINVGDIVYLHNDKDKTKSRHRYLVVSIDGEWCRIKRFSGSQLRSSSYKVKLAECYCVPCQVPPITVRHENIDDDELYSCDVPSSSSNSPPEPVEIPTILSHPPTAYEQYDGEFECHPNMCDTLDPNQSEETIEVPPTTTETVTYERPRRERRPPTHLQDYITDF